MGTTRRAVFYSQQPEPHTDQGPGVAQRLAAAYALRIYLPLSGLSKRWRDWRHPRHQPMSLPDVHWSEMLPPNPIRITELRKSNGNVRISELAVLSLAAAQVPAGQAIVEIGTFDGRTTLNMALNAPLKCPILTLDLPPQQLSKYPLAPGERHFVDKPAPASRLMVRTDLAWSTSRVQQLLGDSAVFDWSTFAGKAGLVFVDGSHSYDYVRADTRTACLLATEGAFIIWHDYGVWDDVTRGLNELASESGVELRRIRGTSLVLWRYSRAKAERLLRAAASEMIRS